MSEHEQPVAETVPDDAGLTPRQALLREIGRRLSEAREAKDEPLSKVVRKLKLRQVHLEALECGDWDSLPDDVYALGFLRQYSAYLSLDLSEDIERIKNDQYTLTRPLTFPDPPVAPSRRWSWIAALAFILLFVAFNVFDLEWSSAPPAPQQQVEEAPKPEIPATQPAAEPAPATDESSAPPADEAADEEPATETEPTAEPAPGPAPSTAQEAPVTAEASTTQPEAQPPILPLHQFRFEAVGDAVWLQVFLPDAGGQGKGKLKKEVLLQSGSGFTLNETVESLWVTCGNAAALQISIDGQIFAEAGSLGATGKVLRDHEIKIQPR